MVKEAQTVDPAVVQEIVELAQDVKALLIKRTARATSEADRVGTMVAALVGAAQELDGSAFTQPGVTASMLQLLALHRLKAIQSRTGAIATRPARDGIEAQHGLNDVFPGDPVPANGPIYATVMVPPGYKDAAEFARDCDLELAQMGTRLTNTPDSTGLLLYGLSNQNNDPTGTRVSIGGYGVPLADCSCGSFVPALTAVARHVVRIRCERCGFERFGRTEEEARRTWNAAQSAKPVVSTPPTKAEPTTPADGAKPPEVYEDSVRPIEPTVDETGHISHSPTAEDRADVQVAKERLREIEDRPETLVSGDDLRKRLGEGYEPAKVQRCLRCGKPMRDGEEAYDNHPGQCP